MTESDRTRRDAVLTKIATIIRDVLPKATDAIVETTTADDILGWNSIAHVQIIVRVERAFAIRIRSTEISRLQNVGSLVDLVVARGTT